MQNQKKNTGQKSTCFKSAESSGKAIKFVLTNLRKNIKFLIKLNSFLTSIKKK